MKDILIYISVVLFIFTVPKIVKRLKIRKYPKSYLEAFFVLIGLFLEGKNRKASKIIKFISDQTWYMEDYDAEALFYIVAIANELNLDKKTIEKLCIEILGNKEYDFYTNYMLFIIKEPQGLEELELMYYAIQLLDADYNSFINKAKNMRRDLFPIMAALVDEIEEVYKTLEYYFMANKRLKEAGKAKRIANAISEEKRKESKIEKDSKSITFFLQLPEALERKK